MGIPDIVFAGSAVLAALLEGDFLPSDLDIFIIGDAGKGEGVFSLIYAAVQQSIASDKGRLLVPAGSAWGLLFVALSYRWARTRSTLEAISQWHPADARL